MLVHLRSLLLAIASIAMFHASPARAADSQAETKIALYRDALAAQIAPEAKAALARMKSGARQLLALRSYLRMGERIEDRWSWSQEQIEVFSKTPEYRQLIQSVDEIKARFEAANPGYSLYANTQVRSLDVQIERWNRNESVGETAGVIQRAVRQELLKSTYPAKPDPASTEQFREFLRSWYPPKAAALAAPGLSLHGQLRAIDFMVMKDGKIVAPTTLMAAETIWQAEGWSEKLKQATADTGFVGPLEVPNEPWHYEYIGPERETRIAGE